MKKIDKEFLMKINVIKYVFPNSKYSTYYAVQVSYYHGASTIGQFKTYKEALKVAKRFKFEKPSIKNLEVVNAEL